MTTKQKAIELVEMYENHLYQKYVTDQEWSNCVECALIAVDQIIKMTETFEQRIYWKEVRNQINLL
jgi:hypothetical protein